MALNCSLIVDRMKSSVGISSDSDLSRLLEITPQAISNFKKKNEIPSDLVIQFADKFELSLDWLISGEGSPKKKRGTELLHTKEDLAPLDELNSKTVQILQSRTIYRTALASNINAFHQAMGAGGEISDLKEKSKRQEIEIESVNNRLAALEKRLAREQNTDDCGEGATGDQET